MLILKDKIHNIIDFRIISFKDIDFSGITIFGWEYIIESYNFTTRKKLRKIIYNKYESINWRAYLERAGT
jgi:hypothetical protein